MTRAWTLRCRVCKTQFGPFTAQEKVQRILRGAATLDCGHDGADVVSESY